MNIYNMPMLRSCMPQDVSEAISRGLKIVERRAARAIILKGDKILLLFTEKYNDYSLPGGGINDGESPVCGLIREVEEETGAKNVRNVRPFGYYEEYRKRHKPENTILHMISYCYTCEVDDELGDTSMEHYEILNGMKPVWVTLEEAVSHNLEVMKGHPAMGQSIERETFTFQHILQKTEKSEVEESA